MTNKTKVYALPGEGLWVVVVDGQLINAMFNSRGAAVAAIPVERARRAKLADLAAGPAKEGQ